MANDRFYLRCTECGDYLYVGKYYPSTGPWVAQDDKAISLFIESHMDNCQKQDHELEWPCCLIFDNEQSLCDAGGRIGGSGNIKVDKAEA